MLAWSLSPANGGNALFQSYLESVNGSVVWVQYDAGQGASLGRPVPAVTTVNNDAHFLFHNGLKMWNRVKK